MDSRLLRTSRDALACVTDRVHSPCNCLAYVVSLTICCDDTLCMIKTPIAQAICLPSVSCPIVLSPCRFPASRPSKCLNHSSFIHQMFYTSSLNRMYRSSCQLVTVLQDQECLAATHGPDQSRSRYTLCNNNYLLNIMRLQSKVCLLSRFRLLRGKHRTHAYQLERLAACSNASWPIYMPKCCTKHAGFWCRIRHAGFVSDRTAGFTCAARAAPALAVASCSPAANPRPFIYTSIIQLSLLASTCDYPRQHSGQSSGVYRSAWYHVSRRQVRDLRYARPAEHICNYGALCREYSIFWIPRSHLHD
jgi:hypothetical protein